MFEITIISSNIMKIYIVEAGKKNWENLNCTLIHIGHSCPKDFILDLDLD